MDPECLRLSVIAVSLWALSATGYGLLLAAQIQTLSFYRAPFFAAYLLLMFIAELSWDPNSVWTMTLWKPVIRSLRICIVMEVFCLGTEYLSVRERRIIVAILAILAIHGEWLVADYVGLALVCVFGNLFWLDGALRRERRHGLIMTLYFAGLAIRGFLEPENQIDWLVDDIYLRALWLVCLVLWAYWALLVAPVKRSQPKSSQVIGQGIDTPVKT